MSLARGWLPHLAIAESEPRVSATSFRDTVKGLSRQSARTRTRRVKRPCVEDRFVLLFRSVARLAMVTPLISTGAR